MLEYQKRILLYHQLIRSDPTRPEPRSAAAGVRETMRAGIVVGVLGGLVLARAAYSTIHYRGLLKIMEDEFSGPPMSVVLELIVGLLLCTWAAMVVTGKFLSIILDSEENRMIYLPANLDFMIFNHRGKLLPLETDLKLKH